jgi:NAD(P)-dependent dehydrogenase (short-subunit alcohol dehydrogenase family)
MGSIGDNSSGGSYGYRMSKAALNMFHKTFSIDFPQITSLVIHPGWVQTDMGGANAPTSVEKSARGILRVIEKASPRDSGDFLDYEGDRLPW